MNKGMFITFEGPDGSGKTTQINMLMEHLKNNGFQVVYTREPGGTKISEKIRDIILDNENSEMSATCEALLYAASRAQHVEELIRPALSSGKVVICDRFVESSVVYQGIGRGLGDNKVRNINDFAINGVQPDLTIMLMIPYEEGLKRKKNQRDLDRLENSGDDFHRKVYYAYVKLAEKCDKIKVINGDRQKEEVFKDILSLLVNKIKL